MRKSFIMLVALAAATCSFSDAVDPFEMVSNLGQDPNSSLGVIDAGVGPYIGNQFTTGAGTAKIGSVTLSLTEHFETAGIFEVLLYADNSSAPGLLIDTFSGAQHPSQNVNETYALSAIRTLDSDTTYWIVAKASGGASDYGWGDTTSTAVDTGNAPGWSIGGAAYLNSDLTVNQSLTTRQQFSISEQIPEPATLSLVVLMGGAMMVIKRRFA